jgi:predicted site-specific integrase-resolvase
MRNGYTIAKVGKLLGVSARTIKRRVSEGIIPAKCYGPKIYRIESSTVVKLKRYGINAMPEAKAHGYRTETQNA